jgi:tetratricopeptide (TPR) repeat protein
MSENLATFLVQFCEPSGLEIDFHLVLAKKPTRQDQKLKTLTKYVKQYPQGWKKRWELAELMYGMGYWEQAIQEHRQVIERQPQLIQVRLQLGKILHLMGRDAEAIEVYEVALLLSRNQATQHHINGLIALCRGDIHKAVIALDLAADIEPDQIIHWLALGQMQMEKEDAVGAFQAFDQVLSLNPDDLVALILSYDALMSVGKYRTARKLLHRLIALAPNDFRVLQRQLDERCRMRLVLGEEGKLTKKMIGSLMQQVPHAGEAHNLLAYYHIFRGEWAKGVAVLQEFTEQHPHNPSSWYYYGQCLFQTGESQAAAEAILNAYRLYPKDCEIYRALCDILPVARHLDELRPLVDKMLTQFPERWSIWVTTGRVLVQHFQEVEQGCNVSVQATKLQPQLADAWFRHGRVLALAGKHQEAVEVLEQGWQLLPEVEDYLQSVPAAVWLGESYQVLGDDGMSRKWWKEACERTNDLRPFDPATADYWQGKALEGLEDGLGAIEVYRRALSQQLLYPARGEVEVVVKRLQALMQKGFRA